MTKEQKKKIATFVDDGVNKSMYTILSDYIPELKGDFSTANLINTIPMLSVNDAKRNATMSEYMSDVSRSIQVLSSNLEQVDIFEDKSSSKAFEENNRILEELRIATKGNNECEGFTTINQFLEYAQNNIENPDCQNLRNAIVRNALNYFDSDELLKKRCTILKMIYIPMVKEPLRKKYPDRVSGECPEWDLIEYISKVLSNNETLSWYDRILPQLTPIVKEAIDRVRQVSTSAFLAQEARDAYVAEALAPSVMENGSLFYELRRQPRKSENSWAINLFEQPEVICDTMADYSDDISEAQRVIAVRYGKFTYSERDKFINNSDTMPDLVSITRSDINGDSKTYWVLMQPLTRFKYRTKGDATRDKGDKPYTFTMNGQVARVLDPNKAECDVYVNNTVPEEQEEFFAKAFFSDEYVSKAIQNNARYLGSVVETPNGLVVKTIDMERKDLAAAHYAAIHPGTVDGKTYENLSEFCRSNELEARRYKLIVDRLLSQPSTGKKEKEENIPDFS